MVIGGCCCCGLLAFRLCKGSQGGYGGYGSSSESDWSEADHHGPPGYGGYPGAGQQPYGAQMPQQGYNPYWQGGQMVTGYQMGPGFDSRVDEFISLSSDGICGRIWHINNAYHRSHIMGCRASIHASFFISFHLFRSFCICLSIAEKQ